MITAGEFNKAYARFKSETSFCSCSPQFYRFLGSEDTMLITNVLFLNEGQEQKVKMLLSPHYKTIIRAWLLIHSKNLPRK